MATIHTHTQWQCGCYLYYCWACGFPFNWHFEAFIECVCWAYFAVFLESFPRDVVAFFAKQRTDSHKDKPIQPDNDLLLHTMKEERKVVSRLSSLERVESVVNHLTTSLKFCWYDTKRGAVWPEPWKAQGCRWKDTQTYTHSLTLRETGEPTKPGNKGQSQRLHSITISISISISISNSISWYRTHLKFVSHEKQSIYLQLIDFQLHLSINFYFS